MDLVSKIFERVVTLSCTKPRLEVCELLVADALPMHGLEVGREPKTNALNLLDVQIGLVIIAEKGKGSWHVHRLESAELRDAAPQGISTLYEGWEFACCSLRRRLALDPPPRMGH